MAYNVFGIPITNATLEAMPDYVGKIITRRDRAHVAFERRTTDGKDLNAHAYVENLKEQSGPGVSTKCLVYNATGDTVICAETNNWSGHIGPGPYPAQIANGQWGAFLHVKTAGPPTGSIGAIVYRGMNEIGTNCDWMLSWSIPWKVSIPGMGNNTVYTEINEAGHYDPSKNLWNSINNSLDNQGDSCIAHWNGCLSDVSIAQGTTAKFVAIMTLENA